MDRGRLIRRFLAGPFLRIAKWPLYTGQFGDGRFPGTSPIEGPFRSGDLLSTRHAAASLLLVSKEVAFAAAMRSAALPARDSRRGGNLPRESTPGDSAATLRGFSEIASRGFGVGEHECQAIENAFMVQATPRASPLDNSSSGQADTPAAALLKASLVVRIFRPHDAMIV